MIVLMDDFILCCDKYLNTCLLFCWIRTQPIGMLFHILFRGAQRLNNNLHSYIFQLLVLECFITRG